MRRVFRMLMLVMLTGLLCTFALAENFDKTFEEHYAPVTGPVKASKIEDGDEIDGPPGMIRVMLNDLPKDCSKELWLYNGNANTKEWEKVIETFDESLTCTFDSATNDSADKRKYFCVPGNEEGNYYSISLRLLASPGEGKQVIWEKSLRWKMDNNNDVDNVKNIKIVISAGKSDSEMTSEPEQGTESEPTPIRPSAMIELSKNDRTGTPRTEELKNAEAKPELKLVSGSYNLTVTPVEGFEVRSVTAQDAEIKRQTEKEEKEEKEGWIYGPIDVTEGSISAQKEGVDEVIASDNLDITVTLTSKDDTQTEEFPFSFTLCHKPLDIRVLNIRAASEGLLPTNAEDGQDIHDRATSYDVFVVDQNKVTLELEVETRNGFDRIGINDADPVPVNAIVISEGDTDESEKTTDNAVSVEGEASTKGEETPEIQDEQDNENADGVTAGKEGTDAEKVDESNTEGVAEESTEEAPEMQRFIASIELPFDPENTDQDYTLAVFDQDDVDEVQVKLHRVAPISVDKAKQLVINMRTGYQDDLEMKGVKDAAYEIFVREFAGETERTMETKSDGETWSVDLSDDLDELKEFSPGEVRFEASYCDPATKDSLGKPTQWSWTVDCTPPEVLDIRPASDGNVLQGKNQLNYFRRYNVFPGNSDEIEMVLVASEPISKLTVDGVETPFEGVTSEQVAEGEAEYAVKFNIPFKADGGDKYPKIKIEDASKNEAAKETDIVLHPVAAIAIIEAPAQDEVQNLAAFEKGVVIRGTKDAEFKLEAFLSDGNKAWKIKVDEKGENWTVTIGMEEALRLSTDEAKLVLVYDNGIGKAVQSIDNDANETMQKIRVDSSTPNIEVRFVNGMPYDGTGKVTVLPGNSVRIELASDATDVREFRLYNANNIVDSNSDAVITLDRPGDYSFSAVDVNGNESAERATLTIERGKVLPIWLDPVEATLSPNHPSVEIIGTAQPGEALNLAAVDEAGNWRYTIEKKDLNDGAPQDGQRYEVRFEYANSALDAAPATVMVTWDETCVLSAPETLVEGDTFIAGTVEPGASLTLNGTAVTVAEDGSFQATLQKPSRSDEVYTLEAADAWDNKITQTIRVLPRADGPEEGEQLRLDSVDFRNGAIIVSGSARKDYGSVELMFTDVSTGDVAVERVESSEGRFTVSHPTQDGEYTVSARYSDYFESYSSAPSRVTVDTTPPEIDVVDRLDDTAERLEFRLNEPVNSCSVTMGGDKLETVKEDDTYIVQLAPNSMLDVNSIVIAVTDKYGNSADRTVTVVHDAEEVVQLSFDAPIEGNALDCEDKAVVFGFTVKSRREISGEPMMMVTDASGEITIHKLTELEIDQADDAWYPYVVGYEATLDMNTLAVGELNCAFQLGEWSVARTLVTEKKNLRKLIIITVAIGALFLAMLVLFFFTSRTYKRNRDAQIDKNSGSSRLTIRGEKYNGGR